jgi:hypothetical protein
MLDQSGPRRDDVQLIDVAHRLHPNDFSRRPSRAHRSGSFPAPRASNRAWRAGCLSPALSGTAL